MPISGRRGGNSRARISGSDSPLVLWLPSTIPSSLWSSVCSPGLIDKETRLRVADLYDTLRGIRRTVKEKSAFWKFRTKGRDTLSQAMQTRSRTILKGLDERLRRLVNKYRRGLRALRVLDPVGFEDGGAWKDKFRDLDVSKDLLPPGYDEWHEEDGLHWTGAQKRVKNGVREGDRYLSWIWSADQFDGRDVGIDENASLEQVYERKFCFNHILTCITLLSRCSP